jgi:RNA polymerase sigma factor (sigma-70 family)
MNTVEDTEIIQRLRDSDETVLSVILRQIVPLHWGLLRRRFGEVLSHEDFEDIVAISLAKLWTKRNSFDGSKGDISGWIYVILRNSALDFLRRQLPKVEESLVVVSLSNSKNPTQEDVAMALQKVIAALSDRERAVLSPLFERTGLSIGDLSKELEMSEGAVRQLRFRATQKLKRELEQMGMTLQRVRKRVIAHEISLGDKHE